MRRARDPISPLILNHHNFCMVPSNESGNMVIFSVSIPIGDPPNSSFHDPKFLFKIQEIKKLITQSIFPIHQKRVRVTTKKNMS